MAALPPIEGFGATSVGGTGGPIVWVTSLADSGPGTLRDALALSGARIIKFAIAGYITLASPLVISNGLVTIDGFSAPGSGVTIRCKLFSATGLQADSFGIFQILNCADVIIRGLALRPGIWPTVPGCTGLDAMGANTCRDPQDIIVIYSTNAQRLVFDHLSLSHQTDLWFNLNDTTDVTIQYCIGSYAYHSYPYMGWGTADDTMRGKGLENYGAISQRYSSHHNLWAHATARMPQMSGLWDSRYEVIYNWGSQDFSGFGMAIHNIHGDTFVNVVSPAFITGPSTLLYSGGSNLTRQFIINDWRNQFPGGENAGNLGVYLEDVAVAPNVGFGHTLSEFQVFTPYTAPAITPGAGIADVYAGAGSMWRLNYDGDYINRRDPIDTQVVADAQAGVAGTGRMLEVNELPPWPAVTPGPTFPQVRARGGSAVTSVATSLTISAATTARAVAGDLILAFFRCSATGSITLTQSGWTEFISDVSDAGNDTVKAWWRTASGVDAEDAITVNYPSSRSAGGAYVLSGALGPPVVSAVAIGSDAAPNAPALSMTWLRDYLYLVFLSAEANAAITGWPANYGNNNVQQSGGATGGGVSVRVWITTRELAAASENPGAATIASANPWSAFTIGIAPIVSGETPVVSAVQSAAMVSLAGALAQVTASQQASVPQASPATANAPVLVQSVADALTYLAAHVPITVSAEGILPTTATVNAINAMLAAAFASATAQPLATAAASIFVTQAAHESTVASCVLQTALFVSASAGLSLSESAASLIDAAIGAQLTPFLTEHVAALSATQLRAALALSAVDEGALANRGAMLVALEVLRVLGLSVMVEPAFAAKVKLSAVPALSVAVTAKEQYRISALEAVPALSLELEVEG